MDWKAGQGRRSARPRRLPARATRRSPTTRTTAAASSTPSGQSATQRFEVTRTDPGAGNVTVTDRRAHGSYAGKPATRAYGLAVHTDDRPGGGDRGRAPSSPRSASQAALDAGRGPGWFYDAATGVDPRQDAPRSRPARPPPCRSTAPRPWAGRTRPTATARVDVDDGADLGGRQGRGGQGDLHQRHNGKPSQVTGTSLTAPSGWAVKATRPVTAKGVASGATFTATFSVTPPAYAEPGSAEHRGDGGLHARTSSPTGAPTARPRRWRSPTSRLRPTTSASRSRPTRRPATSTVAGRASSPSSWRRRASTPGADRGRQRVHVHLAGRPAGDARTTSPAVAQTISLSGQGNALAFLGTGTSGSAGDDATVHYADGTTTTGTLGMPNWCCLATDTYGAKIAVADQGQEHPDRPGIPDDRVPPLHHDAAHRPGEGRSWR